MRDHRKRLGGLLVLLLLVSSVYGEGIEIRSVSSALLGDIYTVNADIEFRLDAEVQEALIHGVELNIDIFIALRRKRKWLWDPGVVESVLRYQLAYHPLSSLYIISNLVNGNRSQFKSLEEACTALGTIRDYMLLNRASLKPDAEYVGRLKAKLNIDNLPPPLQPTAHFSKEWRLQSPWYEWVVR